MLSKLQKEDAGYLNWMRTNMELDDDLKYTLDKVLGSEKLLN